MSLERHTVWRSRPGLGTFVEIRAVGTERARLARAVDRAFARVAEVQWWMSPFRPHSDVDRLNTAPVATLLDVQPATWQVLGFARALSAASDGLFDVTLGTGTAADWRAIELPRRGQVRRTSPVRVDLGGVAKGFAVDSAVDALKSAGVEAGVVNAGGDLRVFGPEPERVWVRDPDNLGRLIPLAEVRDAAIATSANYFDPVGGERLACPDGARRWLGRGSVSVQARRAMVADALTKVVAAIGPRAAAPLLRRYGATALALTEGGGVVGSEPAPTLATPGPETEDAHAA